MEPDTSELAMSETIHTLNCAATGNGNL